MRRVVVLVALSTLAPACVASPDELGTTTQDVSTATRHARLTTIRDHAGQMGLYNAALLGGIATSETQISQCFSEASYACPGPNSPDCNDTPVIAGGADGPCADMQGGLGLFQFDAGTYAQTLATYGDLVLTVAGGAALAVDFVETRTEQDIAGVTDWRTSMAWLNTIPMTAGDPVTEQWASFLACRYNGCCSASATCTTRGDKYRDNAIAVFNEMGAAFWADPCTQVPADGVIDERSACYIAAGDPRYWHAETTGYGGTSEWTMTTTHAAPSNYGEWRIVPNRAAMLHLEVNLDGGGHGQSPKAAYTIVHAGTTDVVTLDQTMATGFAPLGDFAFDGASEEYVMLGDNTGDATSVSLGFDALRVTALDGDPLGSGSGSGSSAPAGCGCTTDRSSSPAAPLGGALVGGVVAFAMARRRRR